VLDGIQRFYADARDLRADFAQVYTYKVYNRTQRSSGQVFFKKARMMRWDYKKPVEKVFVADGRTLWVYEPEENQVFQRDLGSSQLPVALTFMSGEGRLEEEFDARLMQSPAASYVIELIPKRHEGDYRSLLLTVDRATFAVQASTVVDPVGNSNQVTFSNVRINSGLPDAAFRFTPPKGVRVITDR
jgi:outer membrane lipoprotein carrier protein